MRTKTITAYSFDELSDSAKQHANNEYNTEYFWADENEAVLKAFEAIFPVKVKDWSYNQNTGYVSFDMTCTDEVEELTGQRLATYLWNNFKSDLYKGKYFSLWSKTDKNPHYTPNGHAPYGKLKSRHSKIMLEESILTGYCVGYDILKPIFDFMKKPDSRNFRDLMEDCFDSWVKSCVADYDYQMSEKAFAESCEANDYEFDEDGNMLRRAK